MMPPSSLLNEVIESQGRMLHHLLAELIPSGTPVALLDFPNHANVGDSAIWLGEIAALKAIGARIVAVSDGGASFDPDRLERLMPEGIILLHGGGNLGDLWPHRQRFRESVIERFGRRRIIQLPQTIHFASPANVDGARRIFDAHPDLTLLVRDEGSLEIAQSRFRARSILSPDAAFFLGRLARPLAIKPIVWLARTDAESRGHEASSDPVTPTDWLRDPLTVRETNRAVTLGPRIFGRARFSLERAYNWLAIRRLERGRRTLGAGQAVVTDRLHGHILALLMGIPHVLIENSYGKIGSYNETWTSRSPLTFWSDNPKDALALARSLGEDGGVEP